MHRKNLLALGVTAGVTALAAMPLYAEDSWNGQQRYGGMDRNGSRYDFRHNAEIRGDLREIAEGRAEVRQGFRQVRDEREDLRDAYAEQRQDFRQLQAARRAGDEEAIAREMGELRDGRQTIRSERRELFDARAELRSDIRDLRGDQRELRRDLADLRDNHNGGGDDYRHAGYRDRDWNQRRDNDHFHKAGERDWNKQARDNDHYRNTGDRNQDRHDWRDSRRDARADFRDKGHDMRDWGHAQRDMHSNFGKGARSDGRERAFQRPTGAGGDRRDNDRRDGSNFVKVKQETKADTSAKATGR